MTITKTQILNEIKRTAEANGGQPLGRQRFYAETGIKEHDWSGKYWVRWGEAVQEAGYSPNQLQSAYSDQFLLEKLAALVQELGHFPVNAEFRLSTRQDPQFPSYNTFARFGNKAQLVVRLVAFCKEREGYEDVVDICAPLYSSVDPVAPRDKIEKPETFGSVYLLKSGRYYKIGRTNSVGRREQELAIQLPERAKITHSIRTDDPAGIENYWHRRFKESRRNGEWFELSKSDVTAFKRRKFM